MTSPKGFLLISGDFGKTGGMDLANYSLAMFLAKEGLDVHVVAHTIDASLTKLANITWHPVPRPARSTILGEPLLRRVGQRVWQQLGGNRNAIRAVANGGNCPLPDINWCHYVHAATEPMTGSGALRRLKIRIAHTLFVKSERTAVQRARLIIANSERTRNDLIAHCGVDSAKIRTVYCGIDSEQFHPASEEERRLSRLELGLDPHKYVFVFIGALGDRRKGFDTLLKAWANLTPVITRSAQLLVIGSGAEERELKRLAAGLGRDDNIQFLGFRKDVSRILRASDALVSPTRYEPFGLAVLEALCCGLPAIVSADAGVAELYPEAIRPLLLAKADDSGKLAEKIGDLVLHAEYWRDEVRPISLRVRSHTWDAMACEILQSIVTFSSSHV